MHYLYFSIGRRYTSRSIEVSKQRLADLRTVLLTTLDDSLDIVMVSTRGDYYKDDDDDDNDETLTRRGTSSRRRRP